MIDSGEHFIYILFAYSGVAVVTLAMTGLTFMTARRRKQRLEELERMGLRRRSDDVKA